MQPEQVKQILEAALELAECHVSSDGSHYSVIAVGEIFADLRRLKAQQVIYAPLNSYIADGSLHALSIKTYTPEKWRLERKLQML